MQGRARMGRVKSKKSKPILTLPRGARLKSHLIPIPLPLRGGENPRELKQGGWVKRSGVKLSSLWGENTWTPPCIFLPPHPTKHTPKKFSFSFSLQSLWG